MGEPLPRMPLGPGEAVRRSRSLVPCGAGVVVGFIDRGRCSMRVASAPSDVSRLAPSDRSNDICVLLVQVVSRPEQLAWKEWRTWYDAASRCWSERLLDVLVASPTEWRSLL